MSKQRISFWHAIAGLGIWACIIVGAITIGAWIFKLFTK